MTDVQCSTNCIVIYQDDVFKVLLVVKLRALYSFSLLYVGEILPVSCSE